MKKVALLALAISCGPAATGPTDSGTTDAGQSDAGQTADAGMAGDAGTPDTWTNWASGFFVSYCVSCHNPGDAGDPAGTSFDFELYTDVVTNAATIRCGVAVAQDPAWSCGAFPPPRQFPIGTGPKPSDAERGRLVAWIDAGTPQ